MISRGEEEGGRGVYSLVDYLSRMPIDHAALARCNVWGGGGYHHRPNSSPGDAWFCPPCKPIARNGDSDSFAHELPVDHSDNMLRPRSPVLCHSQPLLEMFNTRYSTTNTIGEHPIVLCLWKEKVYPDITPPQN